MEMNASVLYVYGIVRANFDASRAPAGLDDVSVDVARQERGGERVAALVSRQPSQAYAPDVVEQNSGELGWLSPRAMAHDRVLTWAQEHGGVLPLPMFSMWASDGALARSLGEQMPRLERVFERVSGADEFGLRVHRRDAVMLESIGDLDPAMAHLRADAVAASPGQRYLLERKIADQGKSAVRAASHRMANEIFDRLRAIAREAVARPLTPDPGSGRAARVPEATLVLNGAFLVERQKLDAFRAAVGALVRELQPRGLSFDFTGPWPPYNFVGDADGAGLRGDGAR